MPSKNQNLQQADQTGMHLVLGMHPVHISQQTLVAVLMKTLPFLAQNTEGNTQYTLYFFRCPGSDSSAR
ncbi:hypothetical protein [Endozoicomonas numazuensis]|nr:hypothetical protein [Endozoicomonas numazuensis]